MHCSNNRTTKHLAVDGGVSNKHINKHMKKYIKHDLSAIKGETIHRKHSSNKHGKNHSSSEISKRRGGNSSVSRDNNIIQDQEAAAAVGQGSLACALISDHEEDGNNDSVTKEGTQNESDKERRERELQEDIERHTRVFSYSRNPDLFVLVHHSNDGTDPFSDEEED